MITYYMGILNLGSGVSWNLNEKDNKMEKLYIEPTFIQTPALIHFGSWEMGLQAEPGVMIQIPYTFVDVDYIDRNTSVSYEKTGLHMPLIGASGI